jgi:ribosomal protein L37AE/L43A
METTTSKYVCDTCKFTTNYKNVIDKHLSSKKHKDKHDIETADKYSHICAKCSRTYSTYSGLWKHQKKCAEEQPKVQQPKVQQPKVQQPNVQQPNQENTIQIEMIEQPVETEEDFQTKIKMNIIKILLDHVNRDELNKIIDEIYDGK